MLWCLSSGVVQCEVPVLGRQATAKGAKAVSEEEVSYANWESRIKAQSKPTSCRRETEDRRGAAEWSLVLHESRSVGPGRSGLLWSGRIFLLSYIVLGWCRCQREFPRVQDNYSSGRKEFVVEGGEPDTRTG